jgi:peptide/nickel transport system substrate-binding protein
MRRVLPAALVVALVTAACSTTAPTGPGTADGADGSAGDDRDTDLVVALATEPDNLNPVLGFAPHGDGKIFEGLVSINADLQPVPDLAAALPEVSDDGLTYTFTLRDDVTFHDGEPLTSADVRFTYEAALDPDLETPVRADLEALESVETPDDRTVVFHLSEPYAPFVLRTTLGIVPEHLLAGEDLTTTPFNQDPVGTGPYELESWRPGEQLVLTAYEDHRDGEPQVQRATFLFIEDDAARAARVAAGDVDAAVLPPALAARYSDDETWQVVRAETADFRAVVMPTKDNPVTSDPAIRLALSHALDRQAIIDGVLAGGGRPASSPIPPEHPAYEEQAEIAFDPDAARQVLDDAGWAEGTDGVRAKDGRRAEFTLMYPAADSVRQSIALAVQAAAADIGIEVTLEGLSWEAISPRMRRDAVVFGTGAPYDPDLTLFNQFHSSQAYQGFSNPGGYANEEVDRLIEEGRRTLDPDARNEIYREVQRVLTEEQPWIFVAFLEHAYVIREPWTGFPDLVEPHEHGLNGGPWWDLTLLRTP